MITTRTTRRIDMRNRLLAAAVMLSAMTVPLAAQTATVPGPQIVTTGMGEAHVTPDRATIMVGVESRASTAAAAGAETARKQKAILDTLKALGLGSDQLSTTNYSVYPQMGPTTPNNPVPRVTGYTVSNNVRVDVRRIEDVGKLIDAALAKGANEISSLQFTSSKADSVRRVALATAVADARADAETLARAAGGSLGSIVEITTTAMSPRPILYDTRMQVSAARAMVPTPIEPGEQTLNAMVTVRWSFIAK
jgi:uncharacterized protein YggE